MNDSVLVNQVYLIFNRPQFLVDSSVLEKLNKQQIDLIRNCMQKGRYIAYTLFASTWLSLSNTTKTEQFQDSMDFATPSAIYLIIAIILLLVYLALELFHYMLAARKLRKYHKETCTYYKKRLGNSNLEKEDKGFFLDIASKANKVSDTAFAFFRFQLALLSISVCMLGVYYCKTFNIFGI